MDNLQLLEWYRNLQNTTNKRFFPLYFSKKRYLVLMGGGGSGKSIFAGRKLLERLIAEKGHRFLVCRKVARSLKESCFKQLCFQIEQHYAPADFLINKTDLKITYLPNQGEILFAGLDDVEKLKSIYGITGIWIEEASEVAQSDFNQLDIRLRGKSALYKQFLITFNPISVTHWLKRRFFDSPSPQVKAMHSTYADNRFLDREQIAVLEQFRLTDDYHYRVYCLGQWGSTGKSIFRADALYERLTALGEQTPQIGTFVYDYDGSTVTNAHFAPDPNGILRIYTPPQAGMTYCIGCDTAGDGSDRFTAQVVETRTGKQMAALCGQLEEDVFARQIFCLAQHYHTALVGIEMNFSTYPARELLRLGYYHQYRRESLDTITGKIRDQIGFYTTRITRPVIIGNLVQLMRSGVALLYDSATLQEMLAFVRDQNGRPAAENGAHDDLVMALAIAYHIREQQSEEPPLIDIVNTAGWTADQLEDYENAPPALRRQILEARGMANG